MFCKLKPFWILHPKCGDRATCTCKLHANVEFKFQRLRQHGVLKSQSLRKAISSLCCKEVQKCMHRKCSICAERKLEINGFEEGKQVYVYEWRNRQEQRLIKGKIHNVQITTKEKVFGTLETILDERNKLLKTKFCKHVFNIVHQHCAIKRLKEDITEKECLTHIDFSEIYACKIEIEVQGMPFGASRNQVSLHTGVMYYKEEKPESFCSISKNTRHDPAGIWAHLHPVISEIKEKYPLVNTLHFLSDGPTTQYRSKNNFYLMKQKCLTQYGFKTVTWNFSESCHGKSAPDGVGGLVKRTADKQVAYGKDIVSPHDLFTNLKELGLDVKIFLIDDELIIENDGELNKVTTKPVKGTMSLHQIICFNIKVRYLSCFCTKAQTCDCYEPRIVTVSVTEETAVPEHTIPVTPCIPHTYLIMKAFSHIQHRLQVSIYVIRNK